MRFLFIVAAAAALAAPRCPDSGLTLWSANGDEPVFATADRLAGSRSDIPPSIRNKALADFRSASSYPGCQPALVDGLIGRTAQDKIARTVPDLIASSDEAFTAIVEHIEPVWSLQEKRVRSLLTLRVAERFKSVSKTDEPETIDALVDGGRMAIGGTNVCTDPGYLGPLASSQVLFFAGSVRTQFRAGSHGPRIPFAIGTLLNVSNGNIELVFPLTHSGTMTFPLSELRQRSSRANNRP